MNWLRKILGWTWRDERIEELSRTVAELVKVSHRPGRRFEIPPVTIDWTAADCLALRKFFAEPTGRKLIELCGGHALQEALREAQGDRATPKAAGMDALLRFQFNLASDQELISRTAGAQAENQGPGEEENAGVPARSFS